MPAVTVVVTSYRRPHALAACLDGLRAQQRSPDEVVVVLHASDTETIVERGPRVVTVAESGSVAALNAGLRAATGDIVAIVDDDAVPAPDWLERIVSTFARDERIAGVGGRDVVHVEGRILEGRAATVGRIQWFGRHIGNHHIGAGGARDVDVLKGANMALRREAALRHGYDRRLRGPGAQPHSELSICLPLRRRGLRLVYDPEIVVDHHPAPRPAGDARVSRRREAVFDWTYNEALELFDYLRPSQHLAFVTYGLLVGTADAPGLARVRGGVDLFAAAQRARAAAWRTYRTSPRR